MISKNFLTYIYKSYWVSSAVRANLHVELPNYKDIEIEDQQLQQEDDQQQRQSKQLISNCLVMAKTSSLEVFKFKNGSFESQFEISLYANIWHVKCIHSSNSSVPDTIFIISDNLQYVFANIRKDKYEYKYNGDLSNLSQKQLSKDIAQVFISQQAVTEQESKGYIGVYIYECELMIIPFHEFNGVVKVPKFFSVRIMQNQIYNIVPFRFEVNSKQLYILGILYKDEDNCVFQTFEFHDDQEQTAKVSKSRSFHISINLPENQYMNAIPLSNQSILIFSGEKVQVYHSGHNNETGISQDIQGFLITYEHIKNTGNPDFFLICLQDADSQSCKLYLINYSAEEGISLKKKQIINEEQNIDIKYLGECYKPSVLVYLENQYAFIGSQEDDCQLVQIHDHLVVSENSVELENGGSNSLQSKAYLDLKANFTNLSIIFNLCGIKKDVSQKLLIASPFKQSSLNMFQKGVSLTVCSEKEFHVAISNIFVILKQFIFISFKKRTVLVQLIGNKFQNLPDTCYCSTMETIFASEVESKDLQQMPDIASNTLCLQVTKHSLLLIQLVNDNQSNDIKLLQKLDFPIDVTVLQVCAYGNQIAVFFSNNQMYLINTQNENLTHQWSIQFNQSSCAMAMNEQYIVIAFWFNTQLILIDKSGQQQMKIEMDRQIIVKSLIFHKNNKILAGFFDGTLTIFYFKVTADQAKEGNNQGGLKCIIEQFKVMSLGYQPVELRSLKHLNLLNDFRESEAISAVSSEVAILKCLLGKNERFEKIFINMPRVNKVVDIMINQVPYILVVSRNKLQICMMEPSQKFHIQPFITSNSVRYKQSQRVELVQPIFGSYVASISIMEGDNMVYSQLNIQDLKSKDIIKVFEMPDTLIYTLYANDDNLILLGGEFKGSQQSLDKQKQVIQQQQQRQQQQQQVAMQIEQFGQQQQQLLSSDLPFGQSSQNSSQVGVLYCLEMHQDSKIYLQDIVSFKQQVLGIMDCKQKKNIIMVVVGPELKFYRILDFEKNSNSNRIQEVYSYCTQHIMQIVDINENNQILISDPIRSINILQYQEQDKLILPIAKNMVCGKASVAAFYGDGIFMGDNNGNILILKKNETPDSDLERNKLLKNLIKIVAGEHIGEEISSIYQTQVTTSELNDPNFGNSRLNQITFGTTKGSIGVMLSLPDSLYKLFLDLQESFLQERKGLLGFEHAQWKQLKDQSIDSDKCKFIDGDLIRRIPDLPHSQIQSILNRMSTIPKKSVQEITLLIENLENLIF